MCSMGIHMGATWQIQLNSPCSTVSFLAEPELVTTLSWHGDGCENPRCRRAWAVQLNLPGGAHMYSHLTHGPLGPCKSAPKWHLDQCSVFCTLQGSPCELRPTYRPDTNGTNSPHLELLAVLAMTANTYWGQTLCSPDVTVFQFIPYSWHAKLHASTTHTTRHTFHWYLEMISQLLVALFPPLVTDHCSGPRKPISLGLGVRLIRCRWPIFGLQVILQYVGICRQCWCKYLV